MAKTAALADPRATVKPLREEGGETTVLPAKRNIYETDGIDEVSVEAEGWRCNGGGYGWRQVPGGHRKGLAVVPS